MDAAAEDVVTALLKAAREGDVSAIKVVLERVLTPLPRNCPVQFDMPRRPIAPPVYSAQIFLVGAEFTKVYAHHYGSRVRTK